MKLSGWWLKILAAAALFFLPAFWIRHVPDRPAAVGKYRLLYPTFLGNETRNFYGGGLPDSLRIVWQRYFGGSFTRLGKKLHLWSGTGWTGQPVMLREGNREYLFIGGFDHKLHKLDARTGAEVWTYDFGDVIKGTATIMALDSNRILILQGSRMGADKTLGSPTVTSFRALDADGREEWRLSIRLTDSYSRDVDASALVLDSLVALAAENGIFYIIDPDPDKCELRDGVHQPRVLKEITLYEPGDDIRHRGNLVTEASPCRLADRIYVSAGSGHVYGINVRTWETEWRFDTGSDLDGTPTVTDDSCLLVAVEKQYIIGQGGVFKLDPRRSPAEAAVWFLPTGNRRFFDWEGGVVGSVTVQDSLAVFRAIDGNLYLVNHYLLEPDKTARFNQRDYPRPKALVKIPLSPAIATSLIIDDRILTVGYDPKLRIYDIVRSGAAVSLAPRDSLVVTGFFESTPLVWNGRIYVGNRNGWFYCIGE